MKKNRIAKLVVQTIAIAFGILGLLWVFIGLCFVVDVIRNPDQTPIYFMIISLPLGGILIAIAWQATRNFGTKAIRNVVGLIVFAIYTYLLVPKPSQNLTWGFYRFLIPIFLAFLLYKLLSKILIKITRADDIQEIGYIKYEEDAQEGI